MGNTGIILAIAVCLVLQGEAQGFYNFGGGTTAFGRCPVNTVCQVTCAAVAGQIGFIPIPCLLPTGQFGGTCCPLVVPGVVPTTQCLAPNLCLPVATGCTAGNAPVPGTCAAGTICCSNNVVVPLSGTAACTALANLALPPGVGAAGATLGPTRQGVCFTVAPPQGTVCVVAVQIPTCPAPGGCCLN